MRNVPYPGCCGAVITWDFGNTRCTNGAVDKISPEDCDKHLKYTIETHGGRAFLSAILNEDQRKILGHTFYRNGFRKVRSGYNENHRSTLHYFIRVHKKDDVKKTMACTPTLPALPDIAGAS